MLSAINSVKTGLVIHLMRAIRDRDWRRNEMIRAKTHIRILR